MLLLYIPENIFMVYFNMHLLSNNNNNKITLFVSFDRAPLNIRL